MDYRFYTCDVVVNTPFGGNQLAVLPDGYGLTATQMQQVAREFNYSETTFVYTAANSSANCALAGLLCHYHASTNGCCS